jgi:hypothetical protein
VTELVEDCLADLLADFMVVRADAFDRLLVDRDAIRRNEVVVLAAVCERDAVIQAEKRFARTYACHAAVFAAGPAFDHDVDVVDARQQLRREGSDRLSHQLPEMGAFQG